MVVPRVHTRPSTSDLVMKIVMCKLQTGVGCLYSEPIQSRCAVLRYTKLTDTQLLTRLTEVCTSENVSFTDDGLEAIIFTAQGDMRQVRFAKCHLHFRVSVEKHCCALLHLSVMYWLRISDASCTPMFPWFRTIFFWRACNNEKANFGNKFWVSVKQKDNGNVFVYSCRYSKQHSCYMVKIGCVQ